MGPPLQDQEEQKLNDKVDNKYMNDQKNLADFGV